MEFDKQLKDLGLSHQPLAMMQHESPPIKRVNSKGSCSTVDPSGVTLAQLAIMSCILIMILPPDW